MTISISPTGIIEIVPAGLLKIAVPKYININTGAERYENLS